MTAQPRLAQYGPDIEEHAVMWWESDDDEVTLEAAVSLQVNRKENAPVTRMAFASERFATAFLHALPNDEIRTAVITAAVQSCYMALENVRSCMLRDGVHKVIPELISHIEAIPYTREEDDVPMQWAVEEAEEVPFDTDYRIEQTFNETIERLRRA